MRQKRAISSYVLSIGVLGLLMAGSWLAYDLYGAIVKSQVTPEQEIDILPLTGNLNEDVLTNLKQRRQFSDTELQQINSINYEPTEAVQKQEAQPTTTQTSKTVEEKTIITE